MLAHQPGGKILAFRTLGTIGTIGTFLLLGSALSFHPAQARPAHGKTQHHAEAAHGTQGHAAGHRTAAMSSGRAGHSSTRGHYHGDTVISLRSGHGHRLVRLAMARIGGRSTGLQCVTFAREETGIEIAGNAVTWWNHAAGIYDRGERPEVGSILSFKANGRMRLGHVAVVAKVINARLIEIDHANWGGPGARRGGVSRDIPVVDVSADNDWSEVRVGLGQSGDFGSIYPTNGFIYDRASHGVTGASLGGDQITLQPAAAMTRAAAAPQQKPAEEVAEAPANAHPIESAVNDENGGR